MNWAPLVEATEVERFGGKAASLASALQAGLPVPSGVALEHRFVAAIAAGEPGACAALADLPLSEGQHAVRSSAIGEDSEAASFAGQHATELGIRPGAPMRDAVTAVWASGLSLGAARYRERLGLQSAPQMGVVIQSLINAEVAGVLFTRNPVTGASERVIEASWGLGESVVDGRVIPDIYRLSDGGELIELKTGVKRTEVSPDPNGGVVECSVAADRAAAECLGVDQLAALHDLASRCDAIWNGHHDIEWAFAHGGTLYLLQRRPVTAVPARTAP